MEFGKTLREAREAKGYTIAQVAETTHIMTSVIEGLENEDFSRIAAPIYGRGFVKLYCQTVGLEAKPLIDEFMAIMNGEHEIQIKERPVATADEPAPAPANPPPPQGKPVVEQDLFSQNEPVAAEPPPARAPIPTRVPAPAPEPMPAAELMPAAEPIPAAEPKARLSRYASPFHSENRTPPALPGIPWRLILLGIAGLAILIVLAFGIRALYRATSTRPTAEDATAPTVPAVQATAKPAAQSTAKPAAQAAAKPAAQPAAKPAAKPAARTQQQNIPSLYID